MSETHHTNSILVRKYDLIENVSKISLDADYNFERTSHRSYKVSIQELRDFYLKCGSARPLKYTPVNEKEESTKSSFNSLVCLHSRNMKGNQSVPSWSGFKELVSDPDLDKANVGYLPPIPFPLTDLNGIAAVIRRTENIMKYLETNFIFIEADQAIYTKIPDVMFSLKDKGEDLFQTIFPRMYGLQMGMCMLLNDIKAQVFLEKK